MSAILDFVQGRGLPDYEQDRMLRRAVERELSIVGEAVSQDRVARLSFLSDSSSWISSSFSL